MVLDPEFGVCALPIFQDPGSVSRISRVDCIDRENTLYSRLLISVLCLIDVHPTEIAGERARLYRVLMQGNSFSPFLKCGVPLNTFSTDGAVQHEDHYSKSS